jgi:hypothetical protein
MAGKAATLDSNQPEAVKGRGNNFLKLYRVVQNYEQRGECAIRRLFADPHETIVVRHHQIVNTGFDPVKFEGWLTNLTRRVGAAVIDLENSGEATPKAVEKLQNDIRNLYEPPWWRGNGPESQRVSQSKPSHSPEFQRLLQKPFIPEDGPAKLQQPPPEDRPVKSQPPEEKPA